jgi:hypothetical protein
MNGNFPKHGCTSQLLLHNERVDIERRIFREIIADGVKAPSGENSQPWRFIVEGNVLYTCNIDERDKTPYNFSQHGSYIAHGALIENIAISASHYGLSSPGEIFSGRKR